MPNDFAKLRRSASVWTMLSRLSTKSDTNPSRWVLRLSFLEAMLVCVYVTHCRPIIDSSVLSYWIRWRALEFYMVFTFYIGQTDGYVGRILALLKFRNDISLLLVWGNVAGVYRINRPTGRCLPESEQMTSAIFLYIPLLIWSESAAFFSHKVIRDSWTPSFEMSMGPIVAMLHFVLGGLHLPVLIGLLNTVNTVNSSVFGVVYLKSPSAFSDGIGIDEPLPLFFVFM